jgi:Zn-dependent metalloprotease
MSKLKSVSQSPFCGILPPHILKEIVRRGSASQQESAWQTLSGTEFLRGRRHRAGPPIEGISARKGKDRSVFNARHTQDLPGVLVLSETQGESRDIMVREAFQAAGATYDFYSEVYGRDSLDNRGLRLDGSVHFAEKFDNAFWNGEEMVYGDGDGELFYRFTRCLEVIGHELTHGVVQYEAALRYEGQPGALNESFADVFGSLVKQYHLGQTAEQADWLIGRDLLRPKVQGQALRSLKNPGTAYHDPVLGQDRQPAHMRDYIETKEDNGGVHLNSGIPNKAFYEVAIRLGGKAWERAGLIWYRTLTEKLHADADFKHAVRATTEVAGEIFGSRSAEVKAVREGWAAVGLAETVLLPRAAAREIADTAAV